jgi:hypothetical protein
VSSRFTAHEDRRGVGGSRHARVRADRAGDPRGAPRASTRPGEEPFGEARGDELPEGLRASGDRREVLREAKRALDAVRAARAKTLPRGRAERPIEGRRRLRRDRGLERCVVSEHAARHAAGIAADGSRRMVGARLNIKPHPLPAEPAGTINVSDPGLAQPHARRADRCGATTPGPSSAKARSRSPPRSPASHSTPPTRGR